MKVFLRGLTTGLFLQMAVGPVFLFIINLALQRSLYDGLAGVAAVTIVDYLYIALALFGVGKLLENANMKKYFVWISSLILILFGIFFVKESFSQVALVTVSSVNLLSSFSAVFFLTILNPMTIVFFTGLFAAKAVEYNYGKKDMLIFGMATGLATLIFMSLSVLMFSVLKDNISAMIVQILNILVGSILCIYGMDRIYKLINAQN